MRRTILLLLRALIVALLVAALLDLQIPGRSRERVRIHLVDRSASITNVGGPPESLKVENADQIIAYDRDRKRIGDTVAWASFGRNVVFESAAIDPSATDLSGALAAALGRNPTEIILYTDGRGDPGQALFLCRDRGVPVHVFPLGPTSVSDARITRIEAPADAPEGKPVPIAVTVESTAALKLRVKVDAEVRDADLVPGVPLRLPFTLPKPGKFKVDLDVKDDCEQNNHAEGEVYSERRKVLLLSTRFPELPGYAVTRAASLEGLDTFDVAILDDVPLGPDQQERLAAYAANGGGVLLLGPAATSRISPFTPRPDLRVAVVIGVDSSGSMNSEGRWELAVDAVHATRSVFDADDLVVAMTFADQARILGSLDELRKVHPTGGTHIAHGIAEARKFLASRQAGRRHIVLITDGEVSADEPPALRKSEFDQLKNEIGLTIVTTNRLVDVGDNVKIADWKALRGKLEQVVKGINEPERVNPGLLEYRDHPVTKGVPRVGLPRIVRATARLDAQIAASVGQAPDQDPVVAFRPEGQGRVGGFTFPYDARLELLFRQAIEYVAGDGDSGLTLSIDPPLVRARGTSNEVRFETSMTRVVMNQVASNLWEGRLPDGLTGTAIVRKGRARAAATIPCPPELEKLGLDRPALDRIARETSGQVLRSTFELDALPRPSTPAPKSGRTYFLIAALVLVFAEMAVSTFWKV